MARREWAAFSSREEAERALATLEDLLAEFPFSDGVSLSVALSALITPIVRGGAQPQTMSTEQIAPVIELPQRAPDRRRWPRPNLIVVVVAAALACSPLAFGYYDFSSWAPLGIGAVVLVK